MASKIKQKLNKKYIVKQVEGKEVFKSQETWKKKTTNLQEIKRVKKKNIGCDKLYIVFPCPREPAYCYCTTCDGCISTTCDGCCSISFPYCTTCDGCISTTCDGCCSIFLSLLHDM